MKTFFTLLAFLILFSGCSRKDAFFGFEMDIAQKMSASSLQSSKILSKDGQISGIFSIIYLNEVYPKSFNENEYFFIFIFTKEPKEFYNPKKPTDTDLVLKLNSQLPIKVEELPKENRFSYLVDTKSDWNKYYIVSFKKSDTLELVLEDKESSSEIIKYKKD
ncbi:MAG: hypothetical protein WCY51_04480 [Sulfurimonas sp.]|uniref:hypothetical protein n=1 Tax=Sulfurimonas sp. TaxID=2022749 RepID=UPI0025FE692D|nr:hypothetical protein [Sulfurimonas sp.]MCK9453552.1 hypothetical protein [Sulfurimonas sp.]